MKLLQLCFLVVSVLTSTAAWSAPAQIVMIRHGEKLDVGAGLSPQGFQRAGLLPGFFSRDSVVNAYGPPVAIFAMEPNPNKADGSVRPIQTVTPLAKSLNLQIETSFTRDQYPAMAAQILKEPSYDGHTVVICWEHDRIPPMAQAFGLTNGPTTWKGSVFDVAWVLRFDGNSSVPTLQLIGEKVLPTDASTDSAAAAEFYQSP